MSCVYHTYEDVETIVDGKIFLIFHFSRKVMSNISSAVAVVELKSPTTSVDHLTCSIRVWLWELPVQSNQTLEKHGRIDAYTKNTGKYKSMNITIMTLLRSSRVLVKINVLLRV